ncbi:hypothetical protein ABPG74_012020 [Tetrahymena malaccensis]
MDLEKAFKIIFIIISALSYYSFAQDGYWYIALFLAIIHILTEIKNCGERFLWYMMRLFFTIYYLKGDQSLIYFITLQLSYAKEHERDLFSQTYRIFSVESFQNTCIKNLYCFQALLLFYLEYRLVYAVISFLIILDIVLVKVVNQIVLACKNLRQNPQYKQKIPTLTLFCLDIIINDLNITPQLKVLDIKSHYYRGFQRIYFLFLGITIFILNNIYIFSFEGSSYYFVRIYYTLLVISLLPKIKQGILFLMDFLQNGPIIDIWHINNFDLQQLDNYDQNLTKNQQIIILDVQNFILEYQPGCCCLQQFAFTFQNTYQIIKENWGSILNLLLQTNKSILIQFSFMNKISNQNQQPTQIQFYPFFNDMCFFYFLDLEENQIDLFLFQDLKELNQAIINQYNNLLFNFKVTINVNYYEDSLLPLFINNYQQLTIDQGLSKDSSFFKEYNTLKYSFVGPVISFFVLKKITSQYYFAIRSQALFNDLYY